MVEHFFIPKYHTKPINPASVVSVCSRFITDDKCLLCNAYPTDGHLTSIAHTSKVEEMASADEQIGISLPTRRFMSTLGLRQPLTRKSFRRYWGGEVDTMVSVLIDRLKSVTR